MKKSNLPEASRLKVAIDEAEEYLDKWKCAERFDQKYIGLYFGDKRKSGWSGSSAKYINFEVCKALSIIGFRNELKQLEEQLTALD